MGSQVKYILIPVLAGFLFSCQGPAILEPPKFNYDVLIKRKAQRNPDARFALTVQRGINTDPGVGAGRFLYYTSDVNGSSDIWMRDLNNTVNVPVIEHPSEQDSPAVGSKGNLLVFVSYDRDADGDLRLARIESSEITATALAGAMPVNYWDISIDLSKIIQERSQSMKPECRGGASESSPVPGPEGRYLYFVSDRCNRGNPHIWKLDLESEDPPVRITDSVSIEPALSASGRLLAYTKPSRTGGSTIELFDLQTGKVIPLPGLPRSRNGYSFIHRKPALSPDERKLFFLSVRNDSNANGVIDVNDNAGIYGIDLTNEHIRRYLNDEAPLYGLSYSDFINGSLIYAANLFDTINIYFTRPTGVIPGKENVRKQFEFAAQQDVKSPGYGLAMEAVGVYHEDSPGYFLYECRALSAMIHHYRLTGDTVSLNEKLKDFEESARKNPLCEFQRRAYNASYAAKSRMFENAANQRHFQEEDKENTKKANFYYEAAVFAEKSGQTGRAVALANQVTENFPESPEFTLSGVLIVELSVTETNIPAIAGRLLEKNDLPAEQREKIHRVIYEKFQNIISGRAIPVLTGLIAKQKNEEVKKVLQLVLARHYLNDRRYEDALKTAEEGLKGIPEQTGMYVRGWQTIAFANEALENYAAEYDARMKYGGSYRQEYGATVTEEEFSTIISESEDYILRYRQTAASISEDLEDRAVRQFTLIEGDAVSELTGQEKLSVGIADRELIREFCAPSSPARNLIYRLGQIDYYRNYNDFCNDNTDLINGKTAQLSFSEARTAADLMYLVSYANASLMNLLFLHMKRVDLFEDLYKEKAVYYHRLKVEIAIERNDRRLNWEQARQGLLNTGIGQVQDLVIQGDPFEARIFNELVHGYKITLEDGRDFTDHSIMYGYAYTLVRKSVEREKFYDEMQKRGVEFSSADLRSKKYAILRDLKEAEYQLQYILYAEPDNPDAYLLLGWLYQYVDERRDSKLLQEPGIIDQVFTYLTEIQPPEYRDGTYYSEEYSAFFPDRLYEKNIELYRQGLVRIGAVRPRDPGISYIHLNLANNYFNLLNFKSALEHYELAVKTYQKSPASASRPFFSSYKQEGMYYFNRARAYFYEGVPDKSAKEFKKAAAVFNKSEYEPARKEYQDIRFRLAGENAKPYLKNTLAQAAKRLKVSRYRLALISALEGLSLQEAGRHDEAIEAFTLAEFRLFGEGDTPDEKLDRSGLRNFIGISHQKLGEIELSDKSTALAAGFAEDEGLDREDFRYQAQTVPGRLMGCLLGYGEDFSVIGDGRTPYGFSPLRQYELALGIQLQNRIIMGDVDGAAELIERRIDIFESEDADVKLGQLGLISSLNQKGFNLLDLRKYDESFEVFREAADKARQYGELSSYRRNFKNSYLVRFMQIEDEGLSSGQIRDLLYEIEVFRSEFREQVKLNFINQRETEDPEFVFNEDVHGKVIDNRTALSLIDFLTVEGQLHYYRGIALRENGEDEAEVTEAAGESVRILGQALSALEDSGIVDSKKYIRTRVAQARSFFLAGHLVRAGDELKQAEEQAYEFNMLPELFEARKLIAEIALDFYVDSPNREKAQDLLQAVREVRDMPEKYPVLRLDLENVILSFLDFAAYSYLVLGQDRQALEVLEQKRSVKLRNEWVRYPVLFAESVLTEQHRVLRNRYRALRSGIEKETVLRLKREEYGAVVNRNRKYRSDIDYISNEFAKDNHLLRDFVLPVTDIDPGYNQAKVRLFTYLDKYYCITNKDRKIQSLSYRSGNNDVSEEEFWSRCLDFPGYDTIVITGIEGKSYQSLNRYNAESPAALIYSSSFNDKNTGYIEDSNHPVVRDSGKNPFNTQQYDRYVFENFPAEEALATRSSAISIPDIVANGSTASAFILKAGSNQVDDLALAYDIASASGAVSLFYTNKSPDDLKIPSGEKYSEHIAMVWGVNGFNPANLQDAIKERLFNARSRAGFEQQRGNYDRAAKYFRMAEALSIELQSEANLSIRLETGRSMILAGDENADRYMRDLLNGQPSEKKGLVQREWVRALFDANMPQKASEIAREFLEQSTGLQRELRNDVLKYRLLSMLDHSAEPGSDERLKSLPSLLGEDEKPRAAAGYLRHGAHEAAKRMLGDAKFPEDLYAEVVMDGYLLHRYEKPPVAGSSIRSDTGFILSEGMQGNWKFFNDLVANLPETNPPEVRTHRERLFLQWKNVRQNKPVNLQDLSCITIKDLSSGYLPFNIDSQVKGLITGSNRSTSCDHLSRIDRSLAFYLLIKSVPLDPGLQIANMLEELIRSEVKHSRARAAWMALVVAENYLNQKDIEAAYRFFEIHLGHSGASIETEPAVRGRVAVWLRFYGKQIDDNLVLSFGQIESVRAIAEMIIPFPADPDEKDYGRIENGLKRTQELDRPAVERALAINLMVRRALENKRYHTVADLAYYEEQIMRNPSVLPKLKSIAAPLQKKIPENQSVFIMADTGVQFRLVRMTRDSIDTVTPVESSREMKGKLRDYFDRLSKDMPSEELNSELSDFYRSLFSSLSASRVYYWLPGLHARAPIVPGPAVKSFQIPDLQSFLDAPVLRLQGALKKDFKVFVQGAQPGIVNSGSDRAGYQESARLNKMETIAVGRRAFSRNDAAAMHVYMSGLNYMRPLKNGDSVIPWFLSDSDISTKDTAAASRYLDRIAPYLRGPGVMTLRKPSGTGHPAFVKYYYNRNISEADITTRFVNAFAELRKTSSEDDTLYGYRLVAGSLFE